MGGLGEAPTKAFRAPPRFSLSSSSFSEHPQLSSSFHHPASLGERSVALIFGVLRASHFSGSSRKFLTLGAKVRNCCCCRCWCCCCSGFCCCGCRCCCFCCCCCCRCCCCCFGCCCCCCCCGCCCCCCCCCCLLLLLLCTAERLGLLHLQHRR